MRHWLAALLILAGCAPAPDVKPIPPAPVEMSKPSPAPSPSPSPSPVAPKPPPPLDNPLHADLNQTAPATFQVVFETTQGQVVIKVTRDSAPWGADRFYNLAKAGFYNDARFFRVVHNFVAQFGLNGDPKISAAWKEATIIDDPVKISNAKGTLTFAMRGPKTRTTQLFINLRDNARLDNQGFAPFGEVIKGMDVVERLYSDYGDREGPNQGKIMAEGNPYLQEEFPNLDYIKSTKVTE